MKTKGPLVQNVFGHPYIFPSCKKKKKALKFIGKE